MTKVLMISRDPRAADKNSEVFKRLKELSSTFEELHLVILGRGAQKPEFKDKNFFVYPALSKIPFLSFLKTLSVSFLIARKIKGGLISAQDPFETGLAGVIVKKIFGLKLQIQIHTDLFSPMYKKAGLKEKINLFFAGLVLPEADSIRVVSNKIASDVEAFLQKQGKEIPIFTLPVYVDFDKIKKQVVTATEINFPGYDSVVLSVSRLEKEKNVRLSVESFYYLRKSGINALLLIAGEGRERKMLEKLSERLQIKDHVRFLGFKGDTASLYASADAFLQTSLYEGFGIALLEAAIFGLPIVSTYAGIARELGANISSFDPFDISVKLKEALNQGKKSYNLSDFELSKEEYTKHFKESFSC